MNLQNPLLGALICAPLFALTGCTGGVAATIEVEMEKERIRHERWTREAEAEAIQRAAEEARREASRAASREASYPVVSAWLGLPEEAVRGWQFYNSELGDSYLGLRDPASGLCVILSAAPEGPTILSAGRPPAFFDPPLRSLPPGLADAMAPPTAMAPPLEEAPSERAQESASDVEAADRIALQRQSWDAILFQNPSDMGELLDIEGWIERWCQP